MAKTEDPREQEQQEGQLPEQRSAKLTRAADTQPDPKPKITVLGFMDGQIAIRLGWRHGMSVVSQSRFRFLRDDLDMEVIDNADDYLF